eukprot:tig00000849_g4758.t1
MKQVERSCKRRSVTARHCALTAAAALLSVLALCARFEVSWALTTTRDLGLIEPGIQRTITIAAKGLLEDGNEGEKVILGVQLQGGFIATAHISNAAPLSLNKIRVEKSINLTTGWELVTTILDNERYNVVNSLCRGLNDLPVYWRLANMNTVFQAADVYFNVTVAACTPSITSVAPSHGPREGGNLVTLSGHDLALSVADVRVGVGASAVGPRPLTAGDIISVAPDRSSVVLTVPAAAAESVAPGGVTLRLSSETFGNSTASYAFDPPADARFFTSAKLRCPTLQAAQARCAPAKIGI